MPKPGPRTTYQYFDNFNATAVNLSLLLGEKAQDVAESLCIHPFILSRWRKEMREGVVVAKGVEIDRKTAAELKRLRKLEKVHKRLLVEHQILKKAIEWDSKRGQTSSNSSTITR